MQIDRRVSRIPLHPISMGRKKASINWPSLIIRSTKSHREKNMKIRQIFTTYKSIVYVCHWAALHNQLEFFSLFFYLFVDCVAFFVLVTCIYTFRLCCSVRTLCLSRTCTKFHLFSNALSKQNCCCWSRTFTSILTKTRQVSQWFHPLISIYLIIKHPICLAADEIALAKCRHAPPLVFQCKSNVMRNRNEIVKCGEKN